MSRGWGEALSYVAKVQSVSSFNFPGGFLFYGSILQRLFHDLNLFNCG